MARAPFQTLVFPFIITDDGIRYALFRRNESTGGYWQGIAGGGEGEEKPEQAALREAEEEAGLGERSVLYRLESCTMIPVVDVCGFRWGADRLLIPEYAFGLLVRRHELTLSDEHMDYRWVGLDAARELVRWDSNRIALWELEYRIRHGLLPPAWTGGAYAE